MSNSSTNWFPLCIALAACTAEKNAESATARGGGAQSAAVSQPATAQIPLDSLVIALKRTVGTFTKGTDGSWAFSGSDAPLKAFDVYRDSAVVRLADCLVDVSPSAATVAGHSVPVGVMCYWALRRLAYYEWQNESEFKNGWPGDIQPTANAEQLRAAGAAWKKVVQQKRYSLT